ncbi:MAG: hypothetical protein OHK0038_15350 [Flammeovirgaceae bacterium]
MKKLLFSISNFLFINLFIINAFSQGIFQFESLEHQFGEIKEGEKAEKTFVFTNVGNAPIIISEVKASCGCTTPEWTKEPVLPNQKGMIKAVYNSAGRPGAFFKTITITSNASEPTVQLQIKGTVLSDPSKSSSINTIQQNIAKNTPVKNNSVLEMSKTTHNFGKIKKGEIVTYKFPIKNTGSEDLMISGISSQCRCVSFKTSSEKLKAGEEGFLEISYKPTKITSEPESVFVFSNAGKQNFSAITLQGTVVEELLQESLLKQTQKTDW